MLCLTIWILICNFVNLRFEWIMFVHLFMTIWWICTYYFFYSYCKSNPKSLKYIIGLFSIMFLLYVYFSFASQARIQLNRDMDHAVLNYAYNILVFLPLVLLIKNSTVRSVLLFLGIGTLFLSFKRGPLVILPVMYIAYQFAIPDSRLSLSSKFSRLFVAGFFFCMLFYIVDVISGGFLSNRFTISELQDGSNRAEMWSLALEDISNRDFASLLIGKGSGSSIELLSSGVHNEWLEFIFTYGLIGALIYFFFGVSLFRKYLRLKKRASEFAPIIGVLVAFWSVVGIFSGFCFVHTSFYFFATLGIVDALESRYKQQISI